MFSNGFWHLLMYYIFDLFNVLSGEFHGFILMVGVKINDEREVPIENVTIFECRDKCFHDPTCLGFDYESKFMSTTKCWLRNSATECNHESLVTEGCVIHARKEGACGK